MRVVANCLIRPTRSIYEVAGWVRPAWVPPLSFLYVAIQQSLKYAGLEYVSKLVLLSSIPPSITELFACTVAVIHSVDSFLAAHLFLGQSLFLLPC